MDHGRLYPKAKKQTNNLQGDQQADHRGLRPRELNAFESGQALLIPVYITALWEHRQYVKSMQKVSNLWIPSLVSTSQVPKDHVNNDEMRQLSHLEEAPADLEPTRANCPECPGFDMGSSNMEGMDISFFDPMLNSEASISTQDYSNHQVPTSSGQLGEKC